MNELVEMGTVSSRGQIAVPADIRKEMDLKEGNKVLFVLTNDSLLIKKVTTQSFEEITRPLKKAAKKSGLKESDVVGIVHRARKE
ncbi:MAG: AbrB/MazE/SpoVT family DNA-binding domain-containing protein [Nanoarchaeota archaeon]|nr:AbrB/MazE/SpoVT family DNA-binding domain-containing protein [Nanoarchaeota archaeon]